MSQISHFRVEQPASLAWDHIEVSSLPQTSWLPYLNQQPSKPPIRIIKNVSGKVRAGQTLAIMGSSGAGKTTLLNVLTARNLHQFQVSGVVKINNEAADVRKIMEVSAYVQQVDLFIPTLTVKENLIFQALVRMDRQIPIEARAKRIADVMKELALIKCADTMVGNGTTSKGISGGEMKRLAFASEILTNPSIMFCDEPTSGLDAFMAESLVRKIKALAKQGRTIICTIHQPSSEVFSMFDNLLLLADGKVAFMGKQEEALGYFEQIGFKCPTNYNPAEFFVKTLAVVPGKEFESRTKIDMICRYFNKTRGSDQMLRRMSSTFKVIPKKKFQVPQWQQFKALSWRSSLVTKREPVLARIRLFQATVISLFCGLVYYHQPNDQHGLLNLNGALFLMVSSLSYNNCYAVIAVFCSELPILAREHSAGMYRVAPYFISKNLAEVHVFVLIPIVYVSIYYYMVGLVGGLEHFLFTMMVAILVSIVALGFGYFISSLSPTADVGLSVAPLILMPIIQVTGYYINIANIPAWMAWLRHVSWSYYAYQLIMFNQWAEVDNIQCASTSSNSTQCSDASCLASGDDVLKFYDFEQVNVASSLIMLVVLSFACRFMAWGALQVRVRNR